MQTERAQRERTEKAAVISYEQASACAQTTYCVRALLLAAETGWTEEK